MIYYFAGAYERQAELRGYRDEFQRVTGYEVSSRWLDSEPTPFGPDTLNDDPTGCWDHARRDVADLIRSAAIVSFTGQGTRGGRHVEHGISIAMHWGTEELPGGEFRLIVIGRRENIFHTHPDTEVYPDFATFLDHEIAEGLWGK